MTENWQDNPFAALFSSTEAAKKFSEDQKEKFQCKKDTSASETICLPSKQDDLVSCTSSVSSQSLDAPDEDAALLEYLLLVTTSNPPINTWHPCVLMPDSALSSESINIVLFDRLLLEQPFTVLSPDPVEHLSNASERWTYNVADLRESVYEHKALYYLYGVYERCAVARKKIRSSKKDLSYSLKIVETLELEVVNNLFTALQQPSLYESQNILAQLKQLCHNKLAEGNEFDQLMLQYLKKIEEDHEPLPSTFTEVLSEAGHQLQECDLLAVDWRAVGRLEFYAQTPTLAALLLKVPAPGSRSLSAPPRPAGALYQVTALGRLLALSCLPSLPGEPTKLFTNSSRLSKQEVQAVNASVASTQGMLIDRCQQMFLTLLADGQSKPLLLSWLEGCIATNLGRAGLWHVAGAGALTATQYVGDGFMLNLGAVLAGLAHKFTQSVAELGGAHHPIMKVDPSYCHAPAPSNPEQRIPGSYPASLGTMTTLVPSHEEASVAGGTDLQTSAAQPGCARGPPLPDKYTFVTSCFFFANAAIHLGLGVVRQRFERVQQDLNRLHRESNALGQSADARLREIIRERVSELTATYLTLRASMLPLATSLPLTHLLAATAHWLTQIAQQPVSVWPAAPPLSRPVVTPIPETPDQDPVPQSQSWLQYVPEFLVDNIAHLSILARMLDNSDNAPMLDLPVNRRLLSFIIAFMGSSGRIKNPHLRAELAHTLELLILGEPLSSASDVDRTSRFASQLPGLWEQLVVQHPLGLHLPTSVLRVFVSIEVTGQSVTFEDKFKYRGPMYEILKHLWQVSSQREEVVRLSREALASMESTQPPLLLRFVNLLINDNIFLLDEGLTYMAQIKEMQHEKETGEWTSLDPRGREEKERMLQQTSMLARFNNVLGRRTSSTLLLLSGEPEVCSLLCHPTLVERVAAMLNFFLDHLVGPKQRQLKVRDTEQYEFRPGVLVTLICRMYCNLSQQPLFAAAVIADGRSYNSQLLTKAGDVLARIGEASVAESLVAVQRCVSAAAWSQKEEEDLTAAAPERFLDPIMSVLMRDPVLLPSSKMIVERATIARHLLSDQSDPFNRQPLTMDQVIPATELAKDLQEWIKTQKEGQRRALEQQTEPPEEEVGDRPGIDDGTPRGVEEPEEDVLADPAVGGEREVGGQRDEKAGTR